MYNKTAKLKHSDLSKANELKERASSPKAEMNPKYSLKMANELISGEFLSITKREMYNDMVKYTKKNYSVIIISKPNRILKNFMYG